MYRYLLIFISSFLVTTVLAKSPHGEGFKIECSNCHITSNWEQLNPRKFNHNKTRFPLVGQHNTVECRKCHPTLEFAKAKKECVNCHTDMHEGTVGQDCERCHIPKSWIVSNVKQIHQQAGFILVGSHATIDCNLCHKSASLLRFENIRTDCYFCHKANYDATNHKADGFGTDCFTCHNMTGQSWSILGNGFEHGLFPLTGGHNIACIKCHITGEYRTKLSTACVNCHLSTYKSTTNPNHVTANFPTTCEACHTTTNWTTSTFNHSSYFPITSGNHNVNCTICHTNSANYKIFTCLTASCHRNAHNQNQGSNGCYSCHPNARGGG
jgi:hypothetical protein